PPRPAPGESHRHPGEVPEGHGHHRREDPLRLGRLRRDVVPRDRLLRRRRLVPWRSPYPRGLAARGEVRRRREGRGRQRARTGRLHRGRARDLEPDHQVEGAGAAMTSSKFDVQQVDAVTFLRALPDASVDLILTDPAYESLEKHRSIGTTTRLKHSK